MGTFKHNKKRNAGLVYEFLVRHMSQAMIDQSAQVYQKSLGFIRKYYGESTPLAEELELFAVIQNTRGVSENAARRVLGEVQRQATKVDIKKLDIKKSNLIKEINYNFGQNFWDLHRVPEYRLLATIQMVIDASRSSRRLTESVENIQLEEGLVKYMTSTAQYAPPVPPREDIDQLVMAITAKKFQERYARSLNQPQKKILEEYIRFQVTGDESRLHSLIHSEKERINGSLRTAQTMKEFIEDPVMMKRLHEAQEKFSNQAQSNLDQQIEDLMLFQGLIEEVESDG